jgi:hypothetical protein
MAHNGAEKFAVSSDTISRSASPVGTTPETDLKDEHDGRSIHSAGSEPSTITDGNDLEIGNDVLQRTVTPKQPIVELPRSERRGLFARFAVVAEVTNPYDYKNQTKWCITAIIAMAAAAAPVGSAIILRTLSDKINVYAIADEMI